MEDSQIAPQQIPKCSFLLFFNKCSAISHINQGAVMSWSPGKIYSALHREWKVYFFTVPMIFTASTNVADGQISTKIVACISTLTASYKGFIDSNTPSISQNGTHTTYNTSTISEKRSCCGGSIPPPCCTVGSVNVSSSKCGKFKQHMDFICSWPMESWPVENIDPSLSWVLSPFCRLFARVPFCSWQFMSALSFRHLSGRTRSKFMQEVSWKKTNIWKNRND